WGDGAFGVRPKSERAAAAWRARAGARVRCRLILVSGRHVFGRAIRPYALHGHATVRRTDQKTGAAWGKTCPLISPPGFIAVWMLMYQRPENRSVMSWIMSGGSAVAQPFFGAPAGRLIRTGALTPGGAGKWK